MNSSMLDQAARESWATKTLLGTCVILFVMKLLHIDISADSNLQGLLMYDLPASFRYHWQGIYLNLLLNKSLDIFYILSKSPLFERILAGEVWRIFTPALLHGSLMHIGFNLLWLHVIGQQIERRIGVLRYIALILIAAALSNTAQYLMSGYRFVGLSGVVCAMVCFVWARQQINPWEHYQLEPATMRFLSIFVLGLAILQTFFFWMALWGSKHISLGIANTAHIAGGLVGYALAQMDLFRARN